MNETGSYPGQPWLWLYQLWYQVPGFTNSSNVDLIAIYLTGVATVLLLAVPFSRDCATSQVDPLHRLVWRDGHPAEHSMNQRHPTTTVLLRPETPSENTALADAKGNSAINILSQNSIRLALTHSAVVVWSVRLG